MGEKKLREGKGDVHAVGDEELLRRFVAVRDQAAFEEIVRRHGPLVLFVCRRSLCQVQDVEDAFQATFFALASRAASVRQGAALPNWLHRVATRIAHDVQHQNKRRARTMSYDETRHWPREAKGKAADLMLLLDEELERLPAKYRSAILLCDYYGHSSRVAAEMIKVPVGTLLTHLRRGRELLKRRLVRQGVTVSVAGVVSALTEILHAAGPLPTELVHATTRSSCMYLTQQAAGNTVANGKAFPLAQSMVRRLTMTKLLTTSTLCLAVGTLTFTTVTVGWNRMAQAQLYFTDDFEDGDLSDDDPDTWLQGGNVGAGDVLAGDFILNGRGPLTYYPSRAEHGDVTIRTQLRFLESNRSTGGFIFARSPTAASYLGVIREDGMLLIMESFDDRSPQVLREVSSSLDPIARDVLLQLDVSGNQIGLTAWHEGDPMPDQPQVEVLDDTLTFGGVGLGIGEDPRMPFGGASRVAFRHFTVVPEPSTTVVGAASLTSFAAFAALRRRRP